MQTGEHRRHEGARGKGALIIAGAGEVAAG